MFQTNIKETIVKTFHLLISNRCMINIHFSTLIIAGSRKQALSPYQAAQAVFPSLSRSLQKYLRVTRQQPRHTMESILQHLSTCLSYDMSPRAFLEKYLVTSPVLQVSKYVKHKLKTNFFQQFPTCFAN